jgi:tagatose 1,6-diphosphate aldolase
MLSAGASQRDFTNILTYAFHAGASGFLAGRAIWWEALKAFPDVAATREALRADSVPYLSGINALADREALAFTKHRAFAPDGPSLANSDASFRHAYEGID